MVAPLSGRGYFNNMCDNKIKLQQFNSIRARDEKPDLIFLC